MIGEVKPNVLVMDGDGLQEFLAALNAQSEALPAACHDHEGLPMIDSLDRAKDTVDRLTARYGLAMITSLAETAALQPVCCQAAGLARYFTGAAAREALRGEG
jgi:hypothetical protein